MRNGCPLLASVLAVLVGAACAGTPEGGEAPGGVPSIEIAPLSGPVGTTVQVTAANLPRNAPVEIGLGPPRAEYSVLTEARTSDQGTVSVEVVVPSWVEAGRDYVFVVAVQPRLEPKVVSGEFRVKGATP